MPLTNFLTPRVLPPTVSVVPTGNGEQIAISWPASAGVDGYRVYGGFDPVSIRSLISGVAPLPFTQTSFTFTPKPTPPGQVLYFWVAKVVGGENVFFDEVGSYTIKTSQTKAFDPNPHSQETEDNYLINTDSLFFFEEIRRRALAILEDSGEDAELFIKQWTGLPDPTSQDALGLDPNYQGMTRNDSTFGVGFFPGYFPAIPIKVRFGALPNALLDYQVPGLRPLLTNEAWTNWEPLLHEGDIIVRKSTGQRYVISSIAPSNFRGVPITQRMSLDIITPTSQLQKVTDANVRMLWNSVNAADFIRVGFGIVTDGSGGPDFLIF